MYVTLPLTISPKMATATYKVLIVEDDAIIAQLIEHYLIELGHQVIDIIHNGDRALDAIHYHTPDLILLDINLEGTKDGIQLAEIIEAKYNMPYIFITALSDNRTLSRIKDLSPVSYIVKPFKEEDLRVSITIGMANHKRKTSNQELTLDTLNAKLPNALSQKEMDILIEISKGLSNQQIAQQLHLSKNTIKWHTQHIYSKLGVKNRTAAAQFLVDIG